MYEYVKMNFTIIVNYNMPIKYEKKETIHYI